LRKDTNITAILVRSGMCFTTYRPVRTSQKEYSIFAADSSSYKLES